MSDVNDGTRSQLIKVINVENDILSQIAGFLDRTAVTACDAIKTLAERRTAHITRSAALVTVDRLDRFERGPMPRLQKQVANPIHPCSPPDGDELGTVAAP